MLKRKLILLHWRTSPESIVNKGSETFAQNNTNCVDLSFSDKMDLFFFLPGGGDV